MKKFAVIMAVLVILLCALTSCAKEEPAATEEPTVSDTNTEPTAPTAPDAAAFEAYVAAAAGEEWHSRHDNMTRSDYYFADGQLSSSASYYYDSDTVLYKYSNGSANYQNHNIMVWKYPDEEALGYDVALPDDPAFVEDDFTSRYFFEHIYIDDTEVLIETREEDGVFTAISEFSGEENVQDLLNQYRAFSVRQYEDGMTVRYVYRFDKETTDLLSIETQIVYVDGTSVTVSTSEFSFDTEKYDPAKEGEPFAEYFAAASDPEQTHTVTVVYAAGTETEHTVDFVLPHNVRVTAFEQGIQVENLYTDQECTQLFKGNTGTDDLTLYAPAVETTAE